MLEQHLCRTVAFHSKAQGRDAGGRGSDYWACGLNTAVTGHAQRSGRALEIAGRQSVTHDDMSHWTSRHRHDPCRRTMVFALYHAPHAGTGSSFSAPFAPWRVSFWFALVPRAFCVVARFVSRAEPPLSVGLALPTLRDRRVRLSFPATARVGNCGAMRRCGAYHPANPFIVGRKVVTCMVRLCLQVHCAAFAIAICLPFSCVVLRGCNFYVVIHGFCIYRCAFGLFAIVSVALHGLLQGLRCGGDRVEI